MSTTNIRRILVAGATGTLGRHVVNQLKQHGYWVRGMGRNREKLQALRLDDRCVSDLADAAALRRACTDVDAVISCAGASMNLHRLGDRPSFTAVDAAGNSRLLAAAREQRINRFVYVSLYGADSLQQTEYARAHERFVEKLTCSPLDAVIVRPTGFYAFFTELLEMARKGRGMLIGGGRCRTNPIHEADVALACVEGLSGAPRELPVGGPRIYTRRELMELAFTALGRTSRMVRIPPAVFAASLPLLKLAHPRLHGLLQFGLAVSQVDCVAPCYGTQRLEDYFLEHAALRSRVAYAA